jgi:hypothetical protein
MEASCYPPVIRVPVIIEIHHQEERTRVYQLVIEPSGLK